ncbi:hypothetical protein [Endozoicomonas elysicola]|uniref:Uncharacterized protein n=1 Tax=Endozoicomonas elysicola TaxID=305900 RepID=A0A081KF40_9GAMM|nr:hypothetical protein [Endozoicomonas elysicola]KEI72766.1 hypothetical protein GV64_20350 [Endozoicomonas elysicola]
MKGVGGHQPVNQVPINDNKTQGVNKSEGGFGRFKVTLPKTIKQFLSSIFSSKPRDVAIQARDTKPHNPTKQPAIEENNNNTNRAKEAFDQALQQAKGDTQIQKCFEKVCDKLEQMQTYKSDLRHLIRGTDDFRMCSLEIQLAKAEYKDVVKNFNDAVSDDLKIDSSKIEMAMANKHSPFFAQDYAKYQQMKNILL